MGRVLLTWWLIRGDLRRHPVEAAVFLIAITAASATLTLGLALNGATGTLYEQTRTATAGPDIEAFSTGTDAGLATVGRTRGVTQRSGPYLLVYTMVKANGYTARAVAEGRAVAPAEIDRPLVTSGTWLRPGGVVVERGFARGLGVRVGDRITVAGRVFPVVGIAVTAANAVYPWAEPVGPGGGPTDYSGLVWLTEADTRTLSSPSPLTYVLDLRLSNPANVSAFEASFAMSPLPVSFLDWKVLATQDAIMLQGTEPVLDIGALLLGFLAVAGVAWLAAGRAIQQTRRVGLLKAVGAGPGLTGATLLAQYLALALVAAAGGLLAGWSAAPALSDPTTGLTGSLRPTSAGAIGPVVFLALMSALLTTVVPTLRAARASTVRALTDSARPSRRAVLTALSLRLPAPLLLGIHLIARRPFRTLVHAAGITATVTAIMALLMVYAQPAKGYDLGVSVLTSPDSTQGRHILVAITVALMLLAAVNVIVFTWTTALESRRQLAIARTLGATPGQVTAGLSLGQVLPAVPALIGIPAGIGLYALNSHGGMTMPPTWWTASSAAGIVLAIGALTAIPARIMTRRPPARVLSSGKS